MDTLMNSILSTVDRLTRRGGLLNSLIDHIMMRIAPKAIAIACGGTYCESKCEFRNNACNTISCWSVIDYYAAGFPQCESGAFNCSVWNGHCCGLSHCH
jgi:hypothetical protein